MRMVLSVLSFILLSGSLAADDKQDVTDLVRELKTGKPAARAHAAAELARQGSDAASAVPALINALEDDWVAVRHEALIALQRIGPPVSDGLPAFRKQLNSDHPLIRAQAAHALGLLGADAEPAVGDLTAALKDKDINVRPEAAAALGGIGPAARPAVPELIAALSTEQTMKTQAAHALARIGAGAVPQLAAIIKEPGPGRWAVRILGEIGPPAAPAVEPLCDELASASGAASDDAACDIMRTLGRIGPDAAGAAPRLIKILNDGKDMRQRIAAANALGNVRATDAIPEFVKLVREGEDAADLPVVAAGGLVLIEGPKGEHLKLALPKLIAALDNKSALIRREAATMLREVGPAAAEAVPALTRKFQDSDPAVVVDCLWALTAIASPGEIKDSVPQIVQLLSSEIPYVRYTACYALGSIGPAAAEAVPVLEIYLGQPDAHLQLTSAWALVRIKPGDRSVGEACIAPLLSGVSSPNASIRAAAASTFGLLGRPLASRAIEPLNALLKDDDASVREAARDALQKIQPSVTRGKPPVKSAGREPVDDAVTPKNSPK